MKISELLLDFRITSRCHLGCDLCYRNPGIKNQSFDKIKFVISKMYHCGFRRIGITGGEPTIRKDYYEIIHYAKSLGFLTYLSTVGHKFIEHQEKLDPVLNWVGLPIDGITPEVNEDIRSAIMSKQHETIKEIFMWLGNNPTKIKIKLTTVVSKANVNKLKDIVSYVKELPYDFHAWRFYQYCPLGTGKAKRDKLEISTADFIQNMTALRHTLNEPKISWATFEERDMANVIMEPNFDVIIPVADNYITLCNMATDRESDIISSIFGRNDVLDKCAANRFWVN